MTGRYAAQVVLQSKTNMAEDRFVNTFHFLGEGNDVGRDCLDITRRLADFFNTPSTVAHGAYTLTSFLSQEIVAFATVNIYDMMTAKPRIPYVFHFNWEPPLGGGTKNLPEEIALVMSFFSVRNLPTSRNRVYLGPFSDNALGIRTSSVTSRPTPELLNCIADAGTRLMFTNNGAAIDASDWVTDGLFLAGLAGLPGAPTLPSFLQNADFPAGAATSWVIRSPKLAASGGEATGGWGFVTNGWVDNEWDGQSRRRVDASARILIPQAGVTG